MNDTAKQASPDAGYPAESPSAAPVRQPSYWLWVLCLLGVDYFSTLAYQPSITFETAGLLGPFATLIVVLVTLGEALPIYLYIARCSPHGQGSIAMIERLIHGWAGKTVMLILLGFAATDFVMLKTISLADAAEHVTHNTFVIGDRPLGRLAEWARESVRDRFGQGAANYFSEQLVITILLGALGFVFWFLLRRGFNRNVVRVSVPIVALYLLLNALVIGAGLLYLAVHPERVSDWLARVGAGQWELGPSAWQGMGWGGVILLSLFLLPQLSLGLSGFEMSMIVMPQVKGGAGDDPASPEGRIRGTRKLLITAATIMSVYLLGAVLVTTLLIPPAQLAPGGLANNRALSYLASGNAVVGGPAGQGGFFGPAFGLLYDLSTILLLCLAGTSVMTALGALLPRFLLRFGMELKWANRWGVLFMCFALINLAVTLWFRASVQEQRGAYATGVLALMLSASTVTLLDRHRKEGHRWHWFPAIVSVLFLLTLLAVANHYPSGLLIACGFIGTILATSVVSRALRRDELRTIGFEFVDEHSRFLWHSLRLADFPVLVPHRPGRHERQMKEECIRREHQLSADAEIVFIEVQLEDPSNFYQNLLIEVFQEDKTFVIRVMRCVSVAHAIAAVALEMSRYSKPPGLHFGWSEVELLAASWSYLAFGEGNVPWKVRELIVGAEPDLARRPRVIVG